MIVGRQPSVLIIRPFMHIVIIGYKVFSANSAVPRVFVAQG